MIEQLCPELRVLLDAELAAGNAIVESGRGLYGKGTVLILLAKQFLARPATLPPGVAFREVNDPHWWKAEYFHSPSRHCVACRF